MKWAAAGVTLICRCWLEDASALQVYHVEGGPLQNQVQGEDCLQRPVQVRDTLSADCSLVLQGSMPRCSLVPRRTLAWDNRVLDSAAALLEHCSLAQVRTATLQPGLQ